MSSLHWFTHAANGVFTFGITWAVLFGNMKLPDEIPANPVWISQCCEEAEAAARGAQPQDLSKPEWVVIFKIADDAGGRKVVQGSEPEIEFRVNKLRAVSEGDAATKVILITQRYMVNSDWDKCVFFEAQEKKPEKK